MLALRYFKSRAQYFVTERQIGLRHLAKIEFLQGYAIPEPLARIPDITGAAD